MNSKGYFFLLGFCFVVALLLPGCADKALYRQAAQSGWDAWYMDRREVVEDDIYNAMPDDKKVNYLPRSLADAREFERDNAMGLLGE